MSGEIFTEASLSKTDRRAIEKSGLVEADYSIQKFIITFETTGWINVKAKALGSQFALTLPRRSAKVSLLFLTQKEFKPTKAAHFIVSGSNSSVYSYFYFNAIRPVTQTVSSLGSSFILQAVEESGSQNLVYRIRIDQNQTPAVDASEKK